MGFYPVRNYQPLVEISGPKLIPIIIAEQHVMTMAENLPALCEALCREEQFRCVDGDFKMNTSGTFKTAKISLSKKKSVSFKLSELRYVSYIFS